MLLLGGICLAHTDQEEQISQSDPLQCHHRILQYYGFEGWITAKRPPPEEQDGGVRFCQGMEYTCCSRDDFLKSTRLWKQNLQKIKGYLTKIFRIIQKIVMMQSSFIQVAQKLSLKPNPVCKKIDTTFFNPPVAFDKIYSYLKTGFQAMAFAQKGFYCTLCNVKNHKYMMLRQDFSRIMIAMSQKSCDDLIHYFREFIMYKIYYLDPFIVNANNMFNCHEDTDIHEYNFGYNSPYQEMKACIETGGAVCGNVCREFKFGKSSELFMGDLTKYETFLGQFEKFAGEIGISLAMQDEELYIPEYEFEDAEFFKQEAELTEMQQVDLNYGRISDHQILVFPEGIDIFGTALTSNFFLTDQQTTMEKTRIFNTNIQEGETPSLMGDGESYDNKMTVKEINDTAEVEEQEIHQAMLRQEQEKLHELGPDNRPTKDELNNLEVEISRKEDMREKYTEQTGQINDFNPDQNDDRHNEFGGPGRIENSSGIWGMVAVGVLSALML